MLTRLLHIALALSLLLSTTGVGISQHFCGGKLIDTALLGPAESCGMKPLDTTCAVSDKPSEQPSISKLPCCQDIQLFVQADLEASTAEAPLAVAQTAELLAIPFLGVHIATPAFSSAPCHLPDVRPPPLRTQLRLARLQAYLL